MARPRLRPTCAARSRALNRALGADLLAADRETIGLRDDADLWVNALAFRQLRRLPVASHQSAERCRRCLARLAEAAELYRDLLAGFSLRESPSFDEWQIAPRPRRCAEYVGALEWLARGAAALDQLDQASAAARQVAADPLAEPAHRLLIELYANAGRRSARCASTTSARACSSASWAWRRSPAPPRSTSASALRRPGRPYGRKPDLAGSSRSPGRS